MERLNGDIVDLMKDDGYGVSSTDMKQAAMVKAPAKLAQPLIDQMTTAIKADQIASVEIKASDGELSVRLELNMINLPLANGTQVSKMVMRDETSPINVYMIIESPLVNVSNMRIDELMSADDFLANPKDATMQFTNWLEEHFETINDALSTEA